MKIYPNYYIHLAPIFQEGKVDLYQLPVSLKTLPNKTSRTSILFCLSSLAVHEITRFPRGSEFTVFFSLIILTYLEEKTY